MTKNWTVTYGVRGASRVSKKTFATEAAAERFAARWRRSNSIGSYWAKVDHTS